MNGVDIRGSHKLNAPSGTAEMLCKTPLQGPALTRHEYPRCQRERLSILPNPLDSHKSQSLSPPTESPIYCPVPPSSWSFPSILILSQHPHTVQHGFEYKRLKQKTFIKTTLVSEQITLQDSQDHLPEVHKYSKGTVVAFFPPLSLIDTQESGFINIRLGKAKSRMLQTTLFWPWGSWLWSVMSWRYWIPC